MTERNEIKRDLLGCIGLNPWTSHDSSARLQMLSQHLYQSLVVNGNTERRCQTGMEREYGKYTFNVKVPSDICVIKIIERYPYKIGPDAITHNPQTIVIFEDAKTKEIGMIDLRQFCSNHPYFGFEYKPQKGLAELRPGAFVPEGTVLLDSPNITQSGGYKYGIELNIALMSHPATSEDGIVVSSDVLPKLEFKTYERRVVSWGSKRFPLNLYGNDEVFKAFPDIGECIRDDGLLMCLRTHDPNLAVVEFDKEAISTPDLIFDKPTYAGGPGGRIIDIQIQHDIYNNGFQPPNGMDDQPEKYDNARRQFYQEIMSVYKKLRKERGERLVLQPELHRLMMEAHMVLDTDPASRVSKSYRQEPLDEWRVEFVIEYTIRPNIGYKKTGGHGPSILNI